MKKRVLVYGIYSNMLNHYLQKLSNSYEVVGFCDDRYEYRTKTFNYIPFYYPEELGRLDFDYAIVLDKTSEGTENKNSKLLKYTKISKKNILSVFYWGGGAA